MTQRFTIPDRIIRTASGLRRKITGALACIGLLFVIATFTPVLSFWIHWLTGPRWDLPAGDVLVVLGAEGPSDGMIGYATYWRSMYAVRAWREAHFIRVIVTGDEASAQSMANYMVSQGITANLIRKESNSQSTRENAVNTKQLVSGQHGRVAVLSSDYHMRRACGSFRKLGIDPVCIPAPDAGKRYQSLASRWSLLGELSVETAKLIRYYILGYV